MTDAADADLATFIGRNAVFYLTEKRVMAAGGTRLSWNWPACLFTFAWLAYRKMWAATALVGTLTLLLQASLILAWTTPALMLALGLYGNTLYLDHARRRIARVGVVGDATGADAMARAGGVSWPAAVAAVGFGLLAAIAVAVLWGGMLALLFGGFVWWQWLGEPVPR